MGRFVGRERELRALEDAYGSKGSAFIPVYGRRRVGKTELILRFLRDKPHVYYLGKEAPAQLQVKEFLEVAAQALQVPLLATATQDDWKKALLAVVEHHKSRRKLVLVLDEFQWIAQASRELMSVLQECWDRHWRDSGQVMLIICGSFVGFMEREVLGKKRPLFGRRTGQLHLKPLGYREAALFHPRYSEVDRARTYFICGGIPFYLESFSPERSVEMNILHNLLSSTGLLHDEPDFLLREELREVERYSAILMSLGEGQRSATELAEITGVGRSTAYYLKQLVELGYIARRFPLTGRPPTRTSVRYALEDPLLRFWFRFIYPNRSFLAEDPARGFDQILRPDLDTYFGGCFERLCREALPGIYRRAGVSARFDVGEYWDPHVQIDVVGIRGDGWTDLGECKWGKVGSLRAVESELQERTRLFPNPRGATVGKLIFTRQGVRGDVGDAKCWSLRELYEL